MTPIEQKAKRAAYMRQWRADHPEYQAWMKSYLKEYYRLNKEQLNRYGRVHYALLSPEQLKVRRVAEAARAIRERVADKATLARFREKNLQLIRAAKDKPCRDCKRQLEPKKMHFDHVRGVKMFNLGHRASKEHSAKVILKEIAKCEVRCNSCHMKRHQRNKRKTGSWR